MKLRGLSRMSPMERHHTLQAAFARAAEGDEQIKALVAILANDIPGLGPQSAYELLARIGWLILEIEADE